MKGLSFFWLWSSDYVQLQNYCNCYCIFNPSACMFRKALNTRHEKNMASIWTRSF
jgi:hypothetical protein